MEIYYSLIVISFILCFFDFVNLRFVKGCFFLLFCTLLIFLAAFRAVGIDNDSRNYEIAYNFYTTSTIPQIIKGGFGYAEKGFVFLNYYIYKSGGSFRFVLIFLAISTGILNYYFFFKKSKYIFLSLLFYVSFFFFYRDFTQIRYGLAAGLIFWAVDYYLKSNYKMAILLFIISASMHSSVLILLPVLLFIRNIRNIYIYLLLPIPCIILGFSLNILNIFLGFGIGTDHMTLYKEDTSGGSMSISIIGYFLVLLYVFINRKQLKELYSTEGYFYMKMIALSVSLNFLTLGVSIFQRFSFLLFQYAILLLPIILSTMRLKFERKEGFILAYLLFSILLLFYGMRIIDIHLIRPYQTF